MSPNQKYHLWAKEFEHEDEKVTAARMAKDPE